MRILHVINSLDAKSGGPPLIVSRLAAAQVLEGVTCGLLAYEPDEPKTAIPAKLADVPGGKGVKLILLPRAKGRVDFMTAGSARPAIRDAIKDYDFVHLNGVWDPLLLATATECRKIGKPYAITTHGMLDPWCMTQGTLKKKAALVLGYKKMLDQAAFLHLGNTDEQHLMKPIGITSPGEIIPNGIFIEEFNNLPPKGEFYKKHPELNGQPFILFLSRLHYKKGLDYLADAFAIVTSTLSRGASVAPASTSSTASLSDLRLVVAGADDGYKATFEQMIAKNNLQSRTHLTGPLYGTEKLAAFNDARLFCLPSRQEGFSIAITESLACGTPSVVTRDCHYPEVETFGAGVCTELNAQSVADGILRVLAKPREELGQAGYKLVREHFTWPIVARTAMRAYEKYLRSSTRA